MNKYEYIGHKIDEWHIKKQRQIAENSARWLKTGASFRETRKQLNIPRSKIASLVGCSDVVISKFECGRYIERRKVIKKSYRTALLLMEARRNLVMNDFLAMEKEEGN